MFSLVRYAIMLILLVSLTLHADGNRKKESLYGLRVHILMCAQCTIPSSIVGSPAIVCACSSGIKRLRAHCCTQLVVLALLVWSGLEQYVQACLKEKEQATRVPGDQDIHRELSGLCC